MKFYQKAMMALKFRSLVRPHAVVSRNTNLFSRTVRTAAAGLMVCALTGATVALADDPPKSPEDLQREALIEQFTEKMKSYNYPELFKKAADEFGVPVKVLE